MSETETDYTTYVNKPPTDLQARFAEWLMSDRVGYNPASAKTKQEAFEAGVRLGVALRIPFQASPENKEATESRRIQREEELEAAKAARAEARTAKKTAKATAETAEEPVGETSTTRRTPAKAAKAAKAAKTVPPAKAAAPRRGPRPATAASTSAAPF